MDTSINETVWYGIGTYELVQYSIGTVNVTLLEQLGISVPATVLTGKQSKKEGP